MEGKRGMRTTDFPLERPTKRSDGKLPKDTNEMRRLMPEGVAERRKETREHQRTFLSEDESAAGKIKEKRIVSSRRKKKKDPRTNRPSQKFGSKVT